MGMVIQAAGKSNVGQVRTRNEDSFLLDVNLKLFAVADGLGGHPHGDLASGVVVAGLRRWFRGGLNLALGLANMKLHQANLLSEINKWMASTCTAVHIRPDGYLTMAHVGDSRLYRVRQGEIVQLSRDHTEVQDLVDQGYLTPGEARSHPRRHLLTRSVNGGILSIDNELHLGSTRVRQILVQPGDQFLLCTDGLSNELGDDDILQTLTDRALSVQEAVDELIALANNQGGRDNSTAVLIRVVA